jgi:ankyrin repeat protein
MAAFMGDAERARVLVVAAEQDASAQIGCTATPLMMAISAYSEEPGTPASEARLRTRGKLDAAGLLLARCFDIGGVDARGKSALHAAVAAPYPDHVVTRLVERMLECGVSPDLKTHEGVTPLMLAVAAKRKGLVRTFLEGGADVHAQSEAGDSALSIAEKNHDRDLLAVLRKPPSRDGGR